MTNLGNDAIVHPDRATHLLGMTDLGNDVIVHQDRAEHRLVIVDLEEDLIVHVDWAELRLTLPCLKWRKENERKKKRFVFIRVSDFCFS